ncbi:MAG: hypothetical protein IPM95_12570 [Sphingobacteriales bacterium]|nr:hypothetical protein [Sphingobacteriales bacterium]
MTLVVNEDKAPCRSGIPESQSLLILEKGGKEFEPFYQDIKDLNTKIKDKPRQVGKLYIENPLVIQTEPVYTFIKVISKKRINAGTSNQKIVGDASFIHFGQKWYLVQM